MYPSIFRKALIFVVVIVGGAVLPYLLADDKFLGRVESWLSPASGSSFTEPKLADSPPALASKPTTAGKPVPLESYKSPVADPIAARVDAVEENSLYSQTYNVSQNYAAQEYATTPNATVPRSAASGLRDVTLPRVNGPPGVPIESLLTFEVTPDWIGRNWSRVTTRLAELDLQGWRVPVSFDQPSFIGSITYYFDQQRRVQRILVHGYTADATNMVQLATTRYGMQRVPNTMNDLFAASVRGQLVGGLQVIYTPILKSDMQKRCEVLMELNRQQTRYGMSYEFDQILRQTATENRQLQPLDPANRF